MEAELRACGGVSRARAAPSSSTAVQTGSTPPPRRFMATTHRVVMSLAVLALAAGLELSIDDAEAVQKSWPHFFEAIKPLGAEVEYAG